MVKLETNDVIYLIDCSKVWFGKRGRNLLPTLIPSWGNLCYGFLLLFFRLSAFSIHISFSSASFYFVFSVLGFYAWLLSVQWQLRTPLVFFAREKCIHPHIFLCPFPFSKILFLNHFFFSLIPFFYFQFMFWARRICRKRITAIILSFSVWFSIPVTRFLSSGNGWMDSPAWDWLIICKRMPGKKLASWKVTKNCGKKI